MDHAPVSGDRRLRPARWARSLGGAALVAGVVGGGLWTATHGVAHVAWSDVVSSLRTVSLQEFATLAVIWLGGLAIYSVVLASALPGLGVRRGLLLNLSGSAVSNLLPLGGALGTTLNWRMVTRWGHSTGAFAAYCVLTNALDVMTKLVLPVVAVSGLVLASAHVPRPLWAMAAGCLAVLLGAATVVPVARRVTGGSRWRTDLAARLHHRVREPWARIRDLLRTRTPRLLAASAGYVAAQVALFDVSLHAVGLHPAVTVVLVAAAIERLGSLVPFTPGGAGVAEVGAVAWLVGAGLPPVAVVAGVLLYRVFLVVMEIPVGGTLLLGWIWWQRAPRPSTAAGEVA